VWSPVRRALPAAAAVAALAVAAPAPAAVAGDAGTAGAGRALAGRTIRGNGSQTVALRLGGHSPVVVSARSSGGGRFAVALVASSGRVRQRLFDEAGPYRGEAAIAVAPAGVSRLRVTATGRWSLTVTHPASAAGARPVPTRIAGTGSQVVPVVASTSLEERIAATYRGPGRFRVRLIAYGDLVAEVLVFDQVGAYSGDTYLLDWPPGPYLVCVEARGSWTVALGS
jgi:hypothetical protein